MTTENLQESRDNLFKLMVNEQAPLSVTEEIKKIYEDVLMKINTILVDAPANILIKDKFGIASRNASGPEALFTAIGVDDAKTVKKTINLIMNQFKLTLDKASKAPGSDIVFQYSLRILEIESNKMIVALVYGYYYKVNMSTCAKCKEPIVKTREWMVFCSNKCKQAFFRAKKK